jgi:ribonuclease P protein component
MVSLSACVRVAVVPSSARAEQRVARASAFDVSLADVDQGFRSRYRLRKTDEFSSVFAFRRSHRGKNFDLLYRPNTAGTARLGLAVQKKIIRTAADRNQVKRIVRESFRLMRDGLPQCDLVVRALPGLEVRNRSALREEIDALFARLAK